MQIIATVIQFRSRAQSLIQEQAQLLADLPHDRATVVLPVVWRELAGEYPSKLVVGKAYSCTGTRPSCSDHVATAIAVT